MKQICAVVAFAILTALHSAQAATLRWSGQGDYLTADPHAQNEGMNNNINDLIHERLVMRDQTLKIIPALAVSWERTSPTVWKFNLRKDVKFHDGTPFTADDVVFSINRAQSSTSNFKTYANMLGKVRKIDDFTVEFTTTAPNPIMMEHMVAINIVSESGWKRTMSSRRRTSNRGRRHSRRVAPMARARTCWSRESRK